MKQPFYYYKDRVKYDYILQSTIQVDCNIDVINEIIRLFSDEDFLAMYFEDVCLGGVYTNVEYLNDKIHILYGITIVDCKKPFDENYLMNCIKSINLSLNKNLDNFKIEESDIKVDVISKPVDLENIDKKLVSESVLKFHNGVDENKFVLTDDGIVEKYNNSKLENNFAFSKLGLIRECKNLLENNYVLLENDFNNKIETDPETLKQELEQNIEAVDELQKLKDELNDKVDSLMNEGLEQSDEYALVLYTKVGNELEPDVAIQHIDIGGYYVADKMSNVGIYPREEADRYAEIFNRYKKKSNVELQVVSKDDLGKMKLIKETRELILEDEFPTTLETSEPINYETLQQTNMNDILDNDQQIWIAIHFGSVDDFYSTFCDLFSECGDEPDVMISIDDYIKELINEGGIETWKTKL